MPKGNVGLAKHLYPTHESVRNLLIEGWIAGSYASIHLKHQAVNTHTEDNSNTPMNL